MITMLTDDEIEGWLLHHGADVLADQMDDFRADPESVELRFRDSPEIVLHFPPYHLQLASPVFRDLLQPIFNAEAAAERQLWLQDGPVGVALLLELLLSNEVKDFEELLAYLVQRQRDGLKTIYMDIPIQPEQLILLERAITTYKCPQFLPYLKSVVEGITVEPQHAALPLFALAFRQGWEKVARKLLECVELKPWSWTSQQVAQLGMEGYHAYVQAYGDGSKSKGKKRRRDEADQVEGIGKRFKWPAKHPSDLREEQVLVSEREVSKTEHDRQGRLNQAVPDESERSAGAVLAAQTYDAPTFTVTSSDGARFERPVYVWRSISGTFCDMLPARAPFDGESVTLDHTADDIRQFLRFTEHFDLNLSPACDLLLEDNPFLDLSEQRRRMSDVGNQELLDVVRRVVVMLDKFDAERFSPHLRRRLSSYARLGQVTADTVFQLSAITGWRAIALAHAERSTKCLASGTFSELGRRRTVKKISSDCSVISRRCNCDRDKLQVERSPDHDFDTIECFTLPDPLRDTTYDDEGEISKGKVRLIPVWNPKSVIYADRALLSEYSLSLEILLRDLSVTSIYVNTSVFRLNHYIDFLQYLKPNFVSTQGENSFAEIMAGRANTRAIPYIVEMARTLHSPRVTAAMKEELHKLLQERNRDASEFVFQIACSERWLGLAQEALRVNGGPYPHSPAVRAFLERPLHDAVTLRSWETWRFRSRMDNPVGSAEEWDRIASNFNFEWGDVVTWDSL